MLDHSSMIFPETAHFSRRVVHQSLVTESNVKDSTITGSMVEKVSDLEASRVDVSTLKDINRVNASHLTFSDASK